MPESACVLRLSRFFRHSGTLFGIGGSVLFSVRLGAGDKKGARKILANSFTMLIIVSLTLTLLFLLMKEQLLNWFGASEITFPYAETYLTIYTAGTFFALLSMGMNYFITAQGFPMLGMMTTLIGALVNIVLDPVFIFLMDMGVAGAAVATVIAQTSSCLFVLCTLRRKKMQVPLGITQAGPSYGKTDRKDRLLSVPYLCDRQHHYYCDECGPSVLRRTGLRRYADYCGDDCAELSAPDHIAHAWNHGRFPAADQF